MALNATQGRVDFQGLNRRLYYQDRARGQRNNGLSGLLQEEDKQKDPVQTDIGHDNTGQALNDATGTSASASAGYISPGNMNASWFDDAVRDATPDFTTPPDQPSVTPDISSPNFDSTQYAATAQSDDASWFERTARHGLTGLAKQLQTPDDGAPAQEVPTTAHTAADWHKISPDFHDAKASQVQKDARGDRPDFTDYNRITQQVKDEAAKVAGGEGIGTGLLRAFVPGANSFLPQQGAKLQALLIQQKIAKDQAIQQHQQDHPEMYQKRDAYTLSPGQSRFEGTSEIAHNEKPDPADKVKPPNFSMHADPDTGDVSGFDPTTNTLAPTMSPRFDTTGPSIGGAPGFVGQQQAHINPKPPAEKAEKSMHFESTVNPETGDRTTVTYDPVTGNQVGKPKVTPGVGKKVLPADKKPDLAGGKAAVAALKGAAKRDTAVLSKIESDHNLKPGTLGGGQPVSGTTSGGVKYTLHQ